MFAFVFSIVAHVLIAVAWEHREQLSRLAWLDWVKTQSAKLNPAALLMKLDEAKLLPPELQKLLVAPPPPPPPPPDDPPMPQLTFVDVDPAQASEPPKDAKFYSAVNTRAANPETKIESNVPKIDGKQVQFAKVTEVTKPLPPAEPPPSPQPKAPPAQPEVKTVPEPQPQPPPPAPKPVPAPVSQPPKAAPQAELPKKVEPQPLQPAPVPKPAGDTLPQPKALPPAPPVPVPVQVAKVEIAPPSTGVPALNPSSAKPTPPAPPGEAETKIARPRTIKEALARRAESGIVGEQMKQDGGVKQLGVSALDVRGMSFGAYDAAIIQAIQQRWYSLLESRPTPRGRVVVEFRMHFDGRVTDMKVSEADVGELYSLLCQKAIQDPAPFPRWPSDMRRQMQADYRDVRFSFFYN